MDAFLTARSASAAPRHSVRRPRSLWHRIAKLLALPLRLLLPGHPHQHPKHKSAHRRSLMRDGSHPHQDVHGDRHGHGGHGHHHGEHGRGHGHHGHHGGQHPAKAIPEAQLPEPVAAPEPIEHQTPAQPAATFAPAPPAEGICISDCRICQLPICAKSGRPNPRRKR